jgi:hypothetical protein
VQATFASRPQLKTSIINSQTVLRGDGVDFMTVAAGVVAAAQPVHMFAVVDNNGTAGYFVDSGGAADRCAMGQEIAGGAAGKFGAYAGSALVDFAHTPGAPHLYEVLFNGASSSVRVDGTEIVAGDPGANAMTGLSLFARYDGAVPTTGDIAEVIICAGEVTGADLTNLKSYITSRYGLTIA